METSVGLGTGFGFLDQFEKIVRNTAPRTGHTDTDPRIRKPLEITSSHRP